MVGKKFWSTLVSLQKLKLTKVDQNFFGKWYGLTREKLTIVDMGFGKNTRRDLTNAALFKLR